MNTTKLYILLFFGFLLSSNLFATSLHVRHGETKIINGDLTVNERDYITVDAGGILIVKGTVHLNGHVTMIPRHGRPSFNPIYTQIQNNGDIIIEKNVIIKNAIDYHAGSHASLSILGERVNAQGTDAGRHGNAHGINKIEGHPGTHNFVGPNLQMNGMAQEFFGGGGGYGGHTTAMTKNNIDQVPQHVKDLIFQHFPNSLAATNLPIELSSFNVIVDENAIVATWITAQEINTKSFTVEKSIDGKNYTVVEKDIEAAGNSDVELTYEITDMDHNSSSSVYYRLTEYDLDGKSESWIKEVHLENEVSSHVISVYPDPADSQFNVILNLIKGDKATYELVQAETGVMIPLENKEEYNNGKAEFNVSHLNEGIYILLVKINGKPAYNKELIIKH
ncbi:T9SS type A sorting domain-containing protein [Flammeovirga pectinis]|uniref:T9SS type A sorting domain-containing protein n=1 Tax=Flammeovirga pectinis TaxID=2494373 RepID=A0A3S9NYG6_9BACT|nr:T9SS type A sorting domain-containing protein [Flammeovirga pectinis]AZQ61001.1 T9SS type A sorting domain-containing protein [Flammeovirga pectinis]